MCNFKKFEDFISISTYQVDICFHRLCLGYRFFYIHELLGYIQIGKNLNILRWKNYSIPCEYTRKGGKDRLQI